MFQFFSYVQRQWIEKVGPDALSVFNKARRTNNPEEAFNHQINSVGEPHPNAWIFVGQFFFSNVLTSFVSDNNIF